MFAFGVHAAGAAALLQRLQAGGPVQAGRLVRGWEELAESMAVPLHQGGCGWVARLRQLTCCGTSVIAELGSFFGVTGSEHKKRSTGPPGVMRMLANVALLVLWKHTDQTRTDKFDCNIQTIGTMHTRFPLYHALYIPKEGDNTMHRAGNMGGGMKTCLTLGPAHFSACPPALI